MKPGMQKVARFRIAFIDDIKVLAGKEDVSVHTFRHTHISHALNRWGRNVSVVQKWIGHQKLETTQLYVLVSTDDLHREGHEDRVTSTSVLQFCCTSRGGVISD
jgi:site-specific recombinase XerD